MRVNPQPHVESSITKNFLASLNSVKAEGIPNRNLHGELLFTKEDVMASRDELTQLLRAMCFEKGMTKQYVTEKYRSYAHDVLQEVPKKIPTGAGNLLHAIKRDPVSFKTFVKLFACVLNYKFDLTVTMTDPDGKTEEFNYVQTMERIVNSE